MDSKFLGRIVCHSCGESFKHCDNVYTISAKIYDSSLVEFEILSTSEIIDNSQGRKILLNREINFHMHCWKNIAGMAYMP